MTSDNMTYTAVQGVLLTFRRRLAPREVMAFADLLPAVLRALFVAGWDPEAPPVPWARPRRRWRPRPAPCARTTTSRRPRPIARSPALCARTIRQLDLDRVLAAIGPEAQAFWHVDDAPTRSPDRIV